MNQHSQYTYLDNTVNIIPGGFGKTEKEGEGRIPLLSEVARPSFRRGHELRSVSVGSMFEWQLSTIAFTSFYSYLQEK